MATNDDHGKFSIEVRDTYRKQDYPPITQKQIDEGQKARLQ